MRTVMCSMCGTHSETNAAKGIWSWSRSLGAWRVARSRSKFGSEYGEMRVTPNRERIPSCLSHLASRARIPLLTHSHFLFLYAARATLSAASTSFFNSGVSVFM